MRSFFGFVVSLPSVMLPLGVVKGKVSMVQLTLLVLFIGFGLDFTAHAAAPPAPVPQTGQTACYGESGTAVTACAGTGQDGDTVAGMAWPSGGSRTTAIG